MRTFYGGRVAAILFLSIALHGAGDGRQSREEYFGACDASAAVGVGTDHFLAASDDDCILRLYHAERAGAPVSVYDLSRFLGVDSRAEQPDIEAGARLGDRVYWISSHSRTRRGKLRRAGGLFFCTVATAGVLNAGVSVNPEGRPYRELLRDMTTAPHLAFLDLDSASMLAPEEPGGLNIEALCATPDDHLLIGFRNPLVQGRALLLPLLNPGELLRGERARLGQPIQVDLGGLGLRDMTPVEGGFALIAGPFEGHKGSGLFQWRGSGSAPREIGTKPVKKLNPEAVVALGGDGQRRLLVLSDDGSREIDGCECKKLEAGSLRRFRGVWVTEPKR